MAMAAGTSWRARSSREGGLHAGTAVGHRVGPQGGYNVVTVEAVEVASRVQAGRVRAGHGVPFRLCPGQGREVLGASILPVIRAMTVRGTNRWPWASSRVRSPG